MTDGGTDGLACPVGPAVVLSRFLCGRAPSREAASRLCRLRFADATETIARYFVAQCSQPAHASLAAGVLEDADESVPEVAAVEELPPRWSVL